MDHFNTKEEAFEWALDIDDECVDNHRFAYLDDEIGMQEYEVARLQGCCGSFDVEITIGSDFRKAVIGYNYGH